MDEELRVITKIILRLCMESESISAEDIRPLLKLMNDLDMD